MNRRNFLGLMVGGVAAAAAVRTFPFRLLEESARKLRSGVPLVNGSRVYNTYNAGGTPNLQYASAYLNFEQFFTDLAPAHLVITGAGVPAGTLQGY